MDCIVAVTKDWGIGKDGHMLHSIPEDMKFFRQSTLGSTVIMGRATLDSFPGGRPLPKRTNLVLTGDVSFEREGVLTAHSIEEALKTAKNIGEDRIFVIGGESIYRQFLPYCVRAYVTKMELTLPADSFFPDLDLEPDWKEMEHSEQMEHEGVFFRFTTYINHTPKSF